MCDLLWADPVGKYADEVEWKTGSRGCSQEFGNKALSKLLENNKFETVVRAHQVKMKGFQIEHWGKKFDE